MPAFEACPVFSNFLSHPKGPALRWAGRTIAWDMLNNYVHSTSRYLREVAVKKDMPVILIEGNSPSFIVVLCALWRIGAVPCLVKADVPPDEVQSLLEAVKPDRVISARSSKERWAPKARWADIEQVVAYGYNDSFLGCEAALDPKIDLDAPALIRADKTLTHRQLREDPQELAGLFRTLITGEPYTI